MANPKIHVLLSLCWPWTYTFQNLLIFWLFFLFSNEAGCLALLCHFPVFRNLSTFFFFWHGLWASVLILLQIAVVPTQSLSCVRLFCDPMDYSPPGSSVYGTLHTRILKWVAFSYSRGSSLPRDWTHVSSIGRWILYRWAIWEACGQLWSDVNGLSEKKTYKVWIHLAA